MRLDHRPAAVLGLLAAACGNDKGYTVYNTAPGVAIVEPSDGAAFLEGDAITFQATVQDDQQDPETLDVAWSSDVDGLVDKTPADASGMATFTTGALSPTAHVIQVRVVDEKALSATDFVSISITDLEDTPSIEIRTPTEDDSGVEDEPFGFEVVVSDEQDAAADLLVWFESDVDGVFCEPEPNAGGVATCEIALSVGLHALTFGVEDTTGLQATKAMEFEVIALSAIDDDEDGYTEDEGDCDDTDSSVHPGATEYANSVDDDCDGFTDEGTDDFDDDGDGWAEIDGDCDDTDPTSFPGGTEICDGADDDCDGVADDGTECYDDDGDGFTEDDGDCDDADADTYPDAPETADGADDDCDGTIDDGTSAYDDDSDCFCESGTCVGSASGSCSSLDPGDCDDGDASVNPDATEVCDAIDNDCDGTTDGSSATDATTWYRDGDGDGYGGSTTAKDCSAPSGYVSVSGDCDDTAGSVNPSETETCNSTDDDCDGSTDEGVTTTYYRDADGDGYGNPSSTYAGCSALAGYVSNDDDCDDTDASLNPYTVWYLDYDGDGYGGASVTKTQCAQPSGYVATATDCNDYSASSYPGATETCDSSDNDCDGTTDEENASGCTDYYYDYDGDGYGNDSRASKCYCSGTGYYDVTNNDDCYDYNSAANPGAKSYSSSNRGDGSYDYNCDGTESKEYTANWDCAVDWTGFSCDSYTNGWSTSSDPSCGSSGTWRSGCTASYWSCTYKSSSSRTQSCR